MDISCFSLMFSTCGIFFGVNSSRVEDSYRSTLFDARFMRNFANPAVKAQKTKASRNHHRLMMIHATL